MQEKISKEKIKFVLDYIDKLESQFEIFQDNLEICNNENYTFDIIREIINIFKSDIPELESSVIFRNGTASSDASTVIGLLKKYLIDNGYSFKENKMTVIDKFWTNFMTYFNSELPDKDYLKDIYLGYDNWNGGINFLNIDFDNQFKLHYGINYSEEMFDTITNIKMFIELSFEEWIKPEKRYDYTKDVNTILKKFKLPYRLTKGKLISSGYKTTNLDDKIINYAMLERKIQFAEEMIMSKETLDKKVALDYIVDSLQYLVSIQEGDSVKEKYSNSAIIICGIKSSKQYTVIRDELEEIMKIANEFFDIRHNEYLNKSKEVREALESPTFIEYLYNRVYSILYILKMNTNIKK